MHTKQIARYLALTALAWMTTTGAKADLTVTMELVDTEGRPLSTAVPGEPIFADVFLAIDPDEAPLADIRRIQLDTRGSSTSVEIIEIEWHLEDAGLDSAMLYFFDESPPGIFRANYLQGSPQPGFILSLTSAPRRIARLRIVFDGSGELDVTGDGVATPGNPDEGLQVLAGFDNVVTYSMENGDIHGGILYVEVSEAGDTHANDNVGGNPNLNSDDDGTAAPPPRRLCGLSLGSTAMLMFLALAAMSRARRRRM